MNFHIISLFPGAFDSYLNESIIARAIEDKKIKVEFYNPRDYSDDKWRRVDQKPYAGGPGMVIQALPVVKAIDRVLSKLKVKSRKVATEQERRSTEVNRPNVKETRIKIIFFSPGGKNFDTVYAKKTAKNYTDIILVCGRYEGIDARAKKVFQKEYKAEDISIGPFVLTGGELPAMVLLDCVARQIEGVLGNFDSLEESRISSHDVYTRPEVFTYKNKKYRVPKVLLSGNHAEIEKWKSKKK